MTEPKKEKCEACYGSGYINFWTDDGHISMRTCRRCGGYGYVDVKPLTNEELYELVQDNFNKVKVSKDYLNEQLHMVCKNIEISCFICHGAGQSDVFDYDYDIIRTTKCYVCGGTGKITLARYEEMQKKMRGDTE